MVNEAKGFFIAFLGMLGTVGLMSLVTHLIA